MQQSFDESRLTVISSPFVRRRLCLLVVMTILGFAGGFLWGQQVGIRQGKTDTMKAIEQRLNEPVPDGLPM